MFIDRMDRFHGFLFPRRASNCQLIVACDIVSSTKGSASNEDNVECNYENSHANQRRLRILRGVSEGLHRSLPMLCSATTALNQEFCFEHWRMSDLPDFDREKCVRRELIFRDDPDRQRFLDTLAEACVK